MFKRTKIVIYEIILRSTVTNDPMPMPSRDCLRDLEDITKAIKEDIKEAWEKQHQLIA